MFSSRTTTTVSAPANVPVDLNSGRPDWRELAPLLGLVFVLVLPTLLGGALVVASWPDGSRVTGWRALWLGGGAVLVATFGSFILMLRKAIIREITSYQQRKDDWHYAALDKYENSDGLITAQQVSEWSYTEHDMRHVALLALWLIVEQPRSLSIERLTKAPVMLNLGHRSYKLLDMTQDGAASWLNMLARAGIINGRGDRKAGTIAILDHRQAAIKLLTEAAKNPATVVQSEER